MNKLTGKIPCLAFGSAFVIACSKPDDAQFRYASCPMCPISTPMILGDEEDVVVTGSIPDELSVTSTASSIVSVRGASRNCCATGDGGAPACHMVGVNEACAPKQETASLTIDLRAVSAGWCELLIRKPDGSLWGGVRVSVEPAASLAFACGQANPVTLASSGGSCAVTWSATDANGAPLMSTEGVILVSSDPKVAGFGGTFFLGTDTGTTVASPGVTIEGRQPGDATVSAFGGGVIEVLPVHVIP